MWRWFVAAALVFLVVTSAAAQGPSTGQCDVDRDARGILVERLENQRKEIEHAAATLIARKDLRIKALEAELAKLKKDGGKTPAPEKPPVGALPAAPGGAP